MKKAGKTATSQISGSNQAPQQTPAAVSGAASSQPGSRDFSLLSELKKVGQTIGSQVAGSSAQETPADIESLKKKDEEFSKSEAETIRSKVDQIYREHAQKRAAEEQKKKEEALRQMDEKRQKREEINQLKKIEPPNPAVSKTRAEIKNYGAE